MLDDKVSTRAHDTNSICNLLTFNSLIYYAYLKKQKEK